MVQKLCVEKEWIHPGLSIEFLRYLILFIGKNMHVRQSFWLGFKFKPITKPTTQRDPDSEFNSIHFGMEIQKKIFLKLLGLDSDLVYIH